MFLQIVPLLMKQVRREDLGEPEREAEDEFGGESKEGFWYQWLRDCQQLKPAASKAKRPSSGKQGVINKWDKTSSLELLGGVKRLEDTLTELSMRGIRVTSDSRWGTIAQNIPNRYGLEQAKFTRSCKVHFAHLCRAYKAPRRNSKGEDVLDPQVRRALDQLFQPAGETVAPLPRGQGLDPKSGGDRGENVHNSNTPTTEKTDPRGKHLRTPPPPRQIPEEPPSNVLPNQTLNGGSQFMKKSERRDSWEGAFCRNNPSTKAGERIRTENHGDVDYGAAAANDDSREQGPAHPQSHRQEQREKPCTTGNGWDTDSSLQPLAVLARAAAKAENRWETIASQAPNLGRPDPQEHVRSCKEQYQDEPRIYKRPACKENSVPGHKPLPDEVSSRLDKWLQFSNTSKARDPNNTEIPRAEKRSTAPERVAAKPAFKSGVTEKQTAEEWMGGITKNPGLPKEKKRGPGAENVFKTGSMKANCALPNYEGLAHPPMDTKNGTSSSSDSDDDMVWEYRKRSTQKRSREMDGEEHNTRPSPLTGKTGKLHPVDGKGIYAC